MMSIVRDQNLKIVKIWLACILSLVLCLHFNQHASEISVIEHYSNLDVAHAHQHESVQMHMHTDNLYEHVVGYAAIKLLALILLLSTGKIRDRIQRYILLMASRIFKPPKTLKVFSILLFFLEFKLMTNYFSQYVKNKIGLKLFVVLSLILFSPVLLAHGVAEGDKGYIQEIYGVHVIPFIYLGAKHMVTGYDHLLFLVGIIFFLYRMKDIGLYVSLFAIGHSITMLVGVYYNISMNAYIIDAIIGFSIVYKALDNLGAYQRWFGFQPNTKIATLIFGLIHGFGLAVKIQEYEVPEDGLLANLISFNIGVELGQFMALCIILLLMTMWRKTSFFFKTAYQSNVFLMFLGFLLVGLQLTGYFTQ